MAYNSYSQQPMSVFDYVMNTADYQTDRRYTTPRANVTKTDKQFRIDLEVPGFSRSDIMVETKGNTLTVTAKRDGEKVADKQALIAREFNSTMLTRSWNLPKTINTENIEAEYEAGILTLILPYHAAAVVEPRRIEIR
jgi:HSP20 family protein